MFQTKVVGVGKNKYFMLLIFFTHTHDNLMFF